MSGSDIDDPISILCTDENMEGDADDDKDDGEKPSSPAENDFSGENDTHADDCNQPFSLSSHLPSTSGERKQPDSLEMGNDDSSGEFDMSSFIRVRTADDGIFEEDDDDEFDYDFPMPEVELQELKPATRKRKQDIMMREGEAEIIDLDEQFEETMTAEPTYSIDPELFGTRRRDRMPLYLLNPDDYVHDHKKQIQIRRAIITYRHHQDKKEQIIKLTEENKRLREILESTKTKAVELSQCGCRRNTTADLSVLDVKIPVVLPRMYVRGKRPVLAMPYNKCIVSPENFQNITSEQLKTEAIPVVKTTSDGALPQNIVTMGTSRMIQLTNVPRQIIATSNVTTPTRVLSNGKVHTIIRPGSNLPGLRPLNRFLPANIAQPGFRAIQIQNSAPVVPVIKTEPGVLPTASVPITSTIVTIPTTATVKVEGGSDPVTTNRIVFAKRPNTSTTFATTTAPTASQLIFGSRFALNTTQIKVEPITGSPITASQMAFANRIQKQNANLLPMPNKIPLQLTPVQILQQPTPINVLRQPIPVNVLRQPTPLNVLRQPTPIKVLQQATPVTVPQQSTPANVTQQPTTVNGIQQPLPIRVLQQQPHMKVVQQPILSKALQKPLANQVPQQPLAIRAVQQPITNQVPQQPLANRVMQQPITNQVLQLPLANRAVQQPITNKVMQQPITNKVMQQPTSNNAMQQPRPGQIFRTASGQVLRLVQSPSTHINKHRITPVHPILPKIAVPQNRPLSEVFQDQNPKPFSQKDVEDLWKKYEDDDDDELAIIAAINDASVVSEPLPPPMSSPMMSRNRKQSMAQRFATLPGPSKPKASETVPKSVEDALELNKYADIVFEEAD